MNIRKIILSALLLPLALPLAAQGLPTLGKASEITTGELPNGISYYIVKNASLPGYADFALVQPSRSDRTGPRKDLDALPNFRSRKPWQFLADYGVSYGERGYVQHLRDATVMRFRDVPVSGTAFYDSTLLMLLDLSRSSEYRQAVMVCGDVDASAVRERLRVLSMTVPARRAEENAFEYSWRQQDSAVVTTSTGPVGSIRIMYRSPRTDPELMNTIQPVMSHVLASEFEIILDRRIRAAFTSEDIPLAGFRFHYTGSDETSGDELYTIVIETSPECLERAVGLTAGVLSTLDGSGATLDEVSFARSVVSEATARDDDNTHLSNSRYMDKCISAYLYGSNLASESSIGKLFTGRRLDVSRERELLGRYISATLSADRNLHLHARSTVRPHPDSIRTRFAEGWRKGCGIAADIPVQSDTLLLRTPSRKARVRSTAIDAYSGCKMWTFSNGMTVFFKKTADKGAFWYGYMAKGGWTEIPGITPEEAACASEVASLEKTAILSASKWKDLLEMNGISLNTEISLSDIRITGEAPSGKLTLLLKSILAMATNASPDTEAYKRYRREAALRFRRDRYTAEGTRAILDSTMCPSYIYAAGSMPGTPGDDFAERVDSYIAKKGANSHNSIIVLMGDLDEASTLRTLSQILSGFPTGRQRVARPRLTYPLRTCWTTTYTSGDWREKGVSVSLSALWQFSAESNMLLRVACAALEDELARSLSGKGFRYSVSGDAELLPAESVSLYVNCYPVPASGLPASVVPARPSDALDAVRSCINSLSLKEVSPQVLERAKAKVLGNMAATVGNTAISRDNILYRNALGRDLGNSYEGRIKAISASEVRGFFSALSSCQSEFVVE